MANIMTVLVEHDNIDYYKDKLNEINREVVLKALGEDIVDMYTQYENDVYNVQPNMSDVSNTLDNYILGFERPNDLIKIAEEWNSELRDAAVKNLKELEALAKESGFSTVSQYVKENWNSDNFASINYWLKYTLMDLDSEEDRSSFAEDFNKENGKKFAWFKERAGLQYYVFYDTEMFRDGIRDLQYRHENDLTPCMPFNATSCRHMFASCKLADNIDFSSFSTENIVTMDKMFFLCELPKELDLTCFNVSNVVNMRAMFMLSEGLVHLNLSNWDASKVENMSQMFFGCESLAKIDFTNFKTDQLYIVTGMLDGCSSLKELDLSMFNTQRVETMYKMFAGCESLERVNLSSFNTENVFSIESMFVNCKSLRMLDLSNFKTPRLKIMFSAFNSCKSLFALDINNFDISNVKDGRLAFANCKNLTGIIKSNPSVLNESAKATNMFNGCYGLPNFNKTRTNGTYAKSTEEGGYFVSL